MPWKEYHLRGLSFECQLFPPHSETLGSLLSLSDPRFFLLNNGDGNATTDVD